jgi:hypothetical protein
MFNHLLIFHLVIHPDGNIWMVEVVESSGPHSLGIPSQPVTMPESRGSSAEGWC